MNILAEKKKRVKIGMRDMLDLCTLDEHKPHQVLDKKLAKKLINSSDLFPIEFDFAWIWLGYADRVAAKQAFFGGKCLKNGEDYEIVDAVKRTVYFTVENLKIWAAFAKTKQSQDVLACFAQVEKSALPIVPTPIAPTPPTAISPVLVASNDLQRFDKDGIELVINTRTGEAFATQSGYARMSGKDQSTISRRCSKLDAPNAVKSSEIETGYGVKVVALIPAKLVFKWAITDKPELAEAMGEAGATVYIHQLAGFKVTSDAVKKPTPTPTPTPPISLLPSDIRLVQMVSSLKDINFELLNPRFKQGLQDLAADMLGISTPLLPANARDGVWCGVVERAEQLGYGVESVLDNRNWLGRWIAARISDRVKEVRLCNGTQRQINLYRQTPELDAAIVSYFDQKNIKPIS